MPTWRIWISVPEGRIQFVIQSWDMSGAHMLDNSLAAQFGGYYDYIPKGPL